MEIRGQYKVYILASFHVIRIPNACIGEEKHKLRVFRFVPDQPSKRYLKLE